MEKEPVRIGIVSYNINCNFTNYGSALLAWALSRAVERELSQCASGIRCSKPDKVHVGQG